MGVFFNSLIWFCLKRVSKPVEINYFQITIFFLGKTPVMLWAFSFFFTRSFKLFGWGPPQNTTKCVYNDICDARFVDFYWGLIHFGGFVTFSVSNILGQDQNTPIFLLWNQSMGLPLSAPAPKTLWESIASSD